MQTKCVLPRDNREVDIKLKLRYEDEVNLRGLWKKLTLKLGCLFDPVETLTLHHIINQIENQIESDKEYK